MKFFFAKIVQEKVIKKKSINVLEIDKPLIKKEDPSPNAIIKQRESKNPKNFIFQINKLDTYLLKALQSDEVNLTNEEDSNIAIYILRKKLRTQIEIDFLSKIIHSMGIFKSNPEMFQNNRFLSEIVKSFGHQFLLKGETVFNEGDFGNLYYIVLKGEVYCLISKILGPDSEGKQVDFRKWLNEQKNITDNQHQTNFKKLQDKIVAYIYRPGEGFGEISIINREPRTATMLCKEDTHFMTLSKEGYEAVMGQYHNLITKNQINFLQQFLFFEKISLFNIQRILYLLKRMKPINKTILYKENQPADHIYFIKKGMVELSKKCSIAHNDFQKEQNSERIVEIVYVQLQENSYFGEDEIINGLKLRQSRATALGNSNEIYFINKSV